MILYYFVEFAGSFANIALLLLFIGRLFPKKEPVSKWFYHLGNTFDNAIEACCSLPAEQRTIHYSCANNIGAFSIGWKTHTVILLAESASENIMVTG